MNDKWKKYTDEHCKTLTDKTACEYEPLPDHLLNEMYREDSGPCYVGARSVYIEMKTNSLGTLELHPCGKRPCRAVFIYSKIYGWLVPRKGTTLYQRLTDEVSAAVKEKAPGWSNSGPARR